MRPVSGGIEVEAVVSVTAKVASSAKLGVSHAFADSVVSCRRIVSVDMPEPPSVNAFQATDA